MIDDFPFAYTAHGFTWGPLRVQLDCSDKRFGVIVSVGSDHAQFEVRVMLPPGGP